MPPSPPQQTAAGTRSCAGWINLCSVLVVVLVVAGCVVFVAWLSLHPYRPRFTVASLSVSGGQVAFNVSDGNPNRHFGILYEGATRASVLFYDTLVASGPAIAAGWYQPSMNTTSIGAVVDMVGPRTAYHSFSAALRAGRLPLRLQLTTVISFWLHGVFPSVELGMHVHCDLLVGADGSLLRESVGAACRHLEYDDDY